MTLALLATLIIGGGMASAFGGLLLVRRLVSLRFLEEHTGIATAIIQIVGTLYAVLIGFSVVTTWNHFQTAANMAECEANYLNDLFRISQGLTVPQRDDLRGAFVQYGHSVVDDEWNKMEEGQESQTTMDAYTRIWDLVVEVDPVTERDKALYAQMLGRLQDMSDARRQRLIFSRNGLGVIMWFTLIAGAALTVGFTFFFNVRQTRKQMAMSGILAGIVCLNLFTIAVINRPFKGEARIRPDAMRFVVAHMEGTLREGIASSSRQK